MGNPGTRSQKDKNGSSKDKSESFSHIYSHYKKKFEGFKVKEEEVPYCKNENSKQKMGECEENYKSMMEVRRKLTAQYKVIQKKIKD